MEQEWDGAELSLLSLSKGKGARLGQGGFNAGECRCSSPVCNVELFATGFSGF